MPRTSRPLHIFPIALRELRIERIQDISPHMRRLTLAGPELTGGTRDGHPLPPLRSLGFDDHIKLVVPEPDGSLPFIGTQDGERFDWAPGVLSLTRDYTVRRLDLEAGTLDVDVVRHDAGRASDWAFSAQPGDTIGFAGPKASAEVNHDVDWHLLLGDETALPAIGRWLEEAPPGTRVRALIEVPSAEDRQEIATAAEAEITWLVRGDVPAGHSTQLLEALQGLEMLPGRVFAWCAGETLTIAPIRRHLRRELGLPKEDVEVVGYWRRMIETPAPEAEDAPEAPAVTPLDLLLQVHEMSELLAPILLRVVVTLGIPVLLGAGPRTPEELSEAIDVPRERLDALLDGMQALGLVTAEDRGALSLSALGEVLLEESAQEDLDLSDPANRAQLALIGLLQSITTGQAAAQSVIPAPVPRWREEDPEVDAAFESRTEDQLQWNIEPLLSRPELTSTRRVGLVGDGLVPTAIDLATARPEVQVGLHAPAHRAARLRERLNAEAPDAVRERITVLPDAQLPAEGPWDALIAQDALEGRDGREAGELARTLRALSAGPLLLVMPLADDAAHDDHVAEASLTALAATGTPQRTTAQVRTLLESAGLQDVRSEQLGWGFGPSLVTARVPGSTGPAAD